MLNILIVEDDSQLATTLKYLVEDNPRYQVMAIADDADSAIAAAERYDPDIALLDLHLARGTTGFSVAVKLADLHVPCLFVSGKAPSFPMPDLALVDLQLARGTTGFSAAVRLGDFDVPCLFVTGRAPSFPMPDLALGCLLKPFTAEDVHRALGVAEDKLRGRQTLRPRLPANFTIYEQQPVESFVPQAGFIQSRRSLFTRLEHWIAGRA